jgi:hypothetical protein
VFNILIFKTTFAYPSSCHQLLNQNIYSPKPGRFFNNFGDDGRELRFTESGQILIRGALLNPFTKGIEVRFHQDEMLPSLNQNLYYKLEKTSFLIEFNGIQQNLAIPHLNKIREIKSVSAIGSNILIVIRYQNEQVRAFVFHGRTLKRVNEMRVPPDESLQDVKVINDEVYIWSTVDRPNFVNKIYRANTDGDLEDLFFEVETKIQDFAISSEYIALANGFDGLLVFERETRPLRLVSSLSEGHFIRSVDAYRNYFAYSDYRKPISSSRIYLISTDEIVE